MNITSIIAIYFLFFVGSAFFLLPFAVNPSEEVETEKVPGQAESAPHHFDLKRHLKRSALVAAILLAIYYVNWSYGWVTANDIDFFDPPQSGQVNS